MPLVQLDFPNPLNTSVQIGDFAYFSNPIDYGTTGNPNGGEWASTTTPHLTSDQSDIIMIGEITNIIPWDGTVNSIICDMPQALFNQYFSNIIPGGCVQVPSGNNICTDECCNYDAVLDWPVIDMIDPNNPTGLGFFQGSPSDPMNWFFDNPTRDASEIMFHIAVPISSSFGVGNCEVVPGDKNVNGVDDYVSGARNIWVTWDAIQLGVVNCCPAPVNCPYTQQFPLNYTNAVPTPIDETDSCNTTVFHPGHDFSANDIIDKYNHLYPGGNYPYGISYPNFVAHHENYMTNTFNITYNMFQSYGGFTPLDGSYDSGSTTVCTQGSFIMFSKDNKVNLSSALGYYASATLRNDSPDKAELFNIGADIFESSK